MAHSLRCGSDHQECCFQAMATSSVPSCLQLQMMNIPWDTGVGDESTRFRRAPGQPGILSWLGTQTIPILRVAELACVFPWISLHWGSFLECSLLCPFLFHGLGPRGPLLKTHLPPETSSESIPLSIQPALGLGGSMSLSHHVILLAASRSSQPAFRGVFSFRPQ